MTRMFWIDGACASDPAIAEWLATRPSPLGEIAGRWFQAMRTCGDDVLEAMHDGAPTVCLDRYHFAYVNVFTAHVSVGFYLGAELADPNGLLEGAGKHMRHVKLRADANVNEDALAELIRSAYLHLRARLSNDD